MILAMRSRQRRAAQPRQRRAAQSGSRGLLTPGPHNTPHAGPHGAFPSDWKGNSAEVPPKLVTMQAAMTVSPGQVHYDP
jgi:hypothetical protein